MKEKLKNTHVNGFWERTGKLLNEDPSKLAETKRLLSATRIIYIDDNPRTLSIVERQLEGLVGSIELLSVGTEAQYSDALDVLSQSRGENTVLITGMHLGGRKTGRGFICNLYERTNEIIPFIILSGEQGNAEVTGFLHTVMEAQAVDDLSDYIVGQARRTGGYPFIYLKKELAAINPDLIPTAVMALRTLNIEHSNKDAVKRALSLHPYYDVDDFQSSRKTLFARMADEWIVSVFELNRLLRLTDDDSHISDMIYDFGFDDPFHFSYGALSKKIFDTLSMGVITHDITGSRGYSGLIKHLENYLEHTALSESIRYEITNLIEYLMQSAHRIHDYTIQLEREKRGEHDVMDLVKRISLAFQSPVSFEDSGSRVSFEGLDYYLEIAVEQIFVNAFHVINGNPDGNITVNVGKISVADCPDKIKSHFKDNKVKDETSIIRLRIENNCGEIPPEILAKWEAKDENITSTKTHKKAYGLNLIREAIEKLNYGTAQISAGDGKTAVTLYFLQKRI